jgi:replicative DNA helicase
MTHTEQALLSALISDSKFLDQIAGIDTRHFTSDIGRTVFAEIRKQHSAGQRCDAVTLIQSLESIDPVYIGEIAQTPFSTRSIERYAKILIDEDLRRQLNDLSYRLQELASDNSVPIGERIDTAQSELAKLTVTTDDGWVDAYQASIEHSELLERRHDGLITGMPTRLHDFDELLDGGLQRGNLIIIGARPAMGKSAIAMSIGLRMASSCSVGFISLEMSHTDLRDRQAAILSGQPIAAIKRPKDKELSFREIVDAVEQSRDLRWYATEQAGLNINQVKSMARNLKRKKGLDVLMIDYVGLMSGTDPKQPRTYQIEEATKGLKNLAKELDIAVICLAQVNRGVADRSDQTPQLSDLRDSGAIEQDGDVIAFIHRPIQANPNVGAEFEHYALLRVAKNRQGRTGDVHLFYHGSTTNFSSWAGEPPKAKQRQGAML